MRFTTYGKSLAERPPATDSTGATAHMEACGHDSGIDVLLTGTDAYGRKFRKRARSVYGAYMMMRAAWGLERAWHVRPDGTRRLLIVR